MGGGGMSSVQDVAAHMGETGGAQKAREYRAAHGLGVCPGHTSSCPGSACPALLPTVMALAGIRMESVGRPQGRLGGAAMLASCPPLLLPKEGCPEPLATLPGQGSPPPDPSASHSCTACLPCSLSRGGREASSTEEARPSPGPDGAPEGASRWLMAVGSAAGAASSSSCPPSASCAASSAARRRRGAALKTAEEVDASPCCHCAEPPSLLPGPPAEGGMASGPSGPARSSCCRSSASRARRRRQRRSSSLAARPAAAAAPSGSAAARPTRAASGCGWPGARQC